MGSKKKAPPAPKETFLAFEKRDPNPVEAAMALEAGHAVSKWPGIGQEVSPGTLLALMHHETAGTMHPEIRPPSVDGANTRVTSSGRVVGNPTTTAVGLGQVVAGTARTYFRKFGDEIARDANLREHDPASAALLSDYAAGKKVDDAMLLKLRHKADPRIPVFLVAGIVGEISKTLRESGVPINSTTQYVMYHDGRLDLLKRITGKAAASYVPASDSANARAVAANKKLYGKEVTTVDEDGTTSVSYQGINGQDYYMTRAAAVNDQLAARFERQLYGVNYSAFPDKFSMKGKSGAQLLKEVSDFSSADGVALKLPTSLVYQPLNGKEKDAFRTRFVAEVARFGNKGEAKLDDETNNWLRASLVRQGVLPANSPARTLDDPRMKQALFSYQDRVGIKPDPASRGQLTPAVKASLSIYNARIDAAATAQLAQKRAPGGLDLAWLTTLKKNDPLLAAAGQEIIILKDLLAKQGFLKRPSHFETRTTGKKKSKVLVEDRFDGSVSKQMVEAYKIAQVSHGLAPTGKLDQVSYKLLRGEPLSAPPAVAPAPVQPSPPSRERTGRIGGPTALFNDSTGLTEPQVSVAALQLALHEEPTPPAQKQASKPQGNTYG